MSRCHYHQSNYGPGYGMGMGMGYGAGVGGHGGGFGTYNFATLIILILIILQWSRKRGGDDCEDGGFLGSWSDNGILFIIAIFFLVCGCGCGKGVANIGYTPVCGCGY